MVMNTLQFIVRPRNHFGSAPKLQFAHVETALEPPKRGVNSPGSQDLNHTGAALIGAHTDMSQPAGAYAQSPDSTTVKPSVSRQASHCQRAQ